MVSILKFSLVLVGVLLASGLLLSLTACADSPEPSVPPPSAPSFTVSLVDYSYDAAAVIDPFNGSIISPAHRVSNYMLEIKIKNDPGLNNYTVYYTVRLKGFYGLNYEEHPRNTASTSEYTIIYLDGNYRVGDKVDIQVQTELMYSYTVVSTLNPHNPEVSTLYGYQSGYFSPIYTFTMPDPSTALTPSTIPEFTQSIAIIPLTISVLVVAVILKKKVTPNPTANLTD